MKKLICHLLSGWLAVVCGLALSEQVLAGISVSDPVNGTISISWSALDPSAYSQVYDSATVETFIYESYTSTTSRVTILRSHNSDGVIDLNREPGTYSYELVTCFTEPGEYESDEDVYRCSPSGAAIANKTISVSGPDHQAGVFNANPVIEIQNPSAGQVFAPGALNFNVKVSDSDAIARVEFFVTEPFQNINANASISQQAGSGSIYSSTYDAQNQTDGYRKLTVVAEDVWGNTGVQSVVFQIKRPNTGNTLPSNTTPLDFSK